MRPLLAAIALPLLLAACDNSAATGEYQDTVRCYNAATAYAQQYVVSGDADSTRKMLGYSYELRAKAITLGATLGKDQAAVAREFKGEDAGYLRKFYLLNQGSMAPSVFGAGEVFYCNLDRAVQ
jgi:hypothetical protein